MKYQQTFFIQIAHPVYFSFHLKSHMQKTGIKYYLFLQNQFFFELQKYSIRYLSKYIFLVYIPNFLPKMIEISREIKNRDKLEGDYVLL